MNHEKDLRGAYVELGSPIGGLGRGTGVSPRTPL